MFIYNVTTKIQEGIHREWLHWMKEEYIPQLIATGCFTTASILKLLETDDSEGPTYAVQYITESEALYKRYLEQFAGEMRRQAFDKWGNRFIAFGSFMQVVN